MASSQPLSAPPTDTAPVVSRLPPVPATLKVPSRGGAWRVRVTIRTPLAECYAMEYDDAFASHRAAVEAAVDAIDAHVRSPYASETCKAPTSVPDETPTSDASHFLFRIEVRVAAPDSDRNAMQVTVAFADYLDTVNAAVGALRNRPRRSHSPIGLRIPSSIACASVCSSPVACAPVCSSSPTSPSVLKLGGSDGNDVDSRGVTNGSGVGTQTDGAIGGSDGADVGDASETF